MEKRQPEEATEEQKRLEAEFAEFIDRNSWIFAKTYAAFCPHEYIVKSRLPLDEQRNFEKFAQFIRDYGWDAIYGSGWEVRQYYSMGDRYYWTMGAPIPETIILNRAKFDDFIFEVDDFGDLRCRSKTSERRKKKD